ncbi:MAG TPA: MASE1 domain-containing protein [Solirubrobacteraceae bacterium]|nr:MASE1 domain-containing protein [Solirubrobacteraceae bacterium]
MEAGGIPRLTVAGAGRLARAPWLDPRVRYIPKVAALVAVYYAVAHLGFALDFSGPVASIVWLPVGVAIAVLYFAGLRFWPGVVIGDLLVNNYSALPFGSAVGQTFGNLLEVLLATALLRRMVGPQSQLETIGAVMKMVAALALGTLVSAVIGPVSLWLGDAVPAGALADTARTWWLGDFCGALLIVPLALAWSGFDYRAGWGRSWIEVVLGLGAVTGTSAVVFHNANPLGYLVFPPLIWAALRIGQRGATVAVAIAAGFAVWATTHYIGPFQSHSLVRSVLETQLFILVASVSMLSLAAVVSERERFAESLWASRMRLVEAVDGERRRLENNLHDGAQVRLTTLLIRVGMAQDADGDAPAPIAELLAKLRSELAIVIDDLRQISHGKHPRVLTERGLSKAIESLAAQSTIPLEMLELPGPRLPEATEATAYYVIAEAVTNAQRYAKPSSIQVRARVMHDVLEVEVVDDGIGNAVEIDGHGLQGLRDRVETFGGTFDVESPARHGTRVAAAIPAHPAAEHSSR